MTSFAIDQLERPLRDLRISVTDRCNFRCVYCMPKEIFGHDYRFLERDSLLSFEEIRRVAAVFVSLGARKIRLTGGEPLLRRELPRLVEMLAELGVDLALTTNGFLLSGLASDLKNAGLDRVTVSLDAITEKTFSRMIGSGGDAKGPASLSRVLEGLDAAARAGFAPIKINMVVRRGLNEGDVLGMARRFRGTGHIVRFIEYMDVGHTNGWRIEDVVPASDLVATIDRQLPLEAIDPPDPDGRDASHVGRVARRWRYRDGSGEIGVIASVTEPFCSGCTRMRLSADGKLFTCLFATRGSDLMELLRTGVTDEVLTDAVRGLWSERRDRYSEQRSERTRGLPKIEMSYIGG